MNKLSILTFLGLIGLSLSVSAGRYDGPQTRDARSAVKGLHGKSDQSPRYQSKQYGKKPHSSRHSSYQRSHGQSTRQGGFNRDYRDNRHFDDRYVVTRPGHSQRSYSNKHRRYTYGDWRHDSRRYRDQWHRRGHTLYHYQPYSHDRYRYRPVRGLGHYYERRGYGYGHWHEGHWCRVYHEPSYYVSYYSHYPYHNGWRIGDGDFGIWFNF